MRQFLIVVVFLSFVAPSFAQVFGEVSGTVKDERGTPLPGVSIYLEGTTKGTTTDFDGNYVLTNLEPSSYNLVFRYVGYESQTVYNVVIRSKGTLNYNIVLKASAENLDELIISNTNKITKPRETPLSTQTLSAVEIATYPGSNNDVVQVAQTLPGVSPSVGGFRNDLIIRGGAPNETVYYLDGVEVPNINHFSTQGSAGGPVGLVNVSFINEVTLSTSAFGAQYDNPLSGVLQFTQRKGDNKNFRGNFRVSASEAALTLESPLFKRGKEKSNTTFIASVRRSYLQFLFQTIGLPFRPDYWDYQFKIDHQIDDYNNVSLIGLGSIDNFTLEAPEDFDPEQQAQLDQAPFINQRTNTTGITWKRRFRDNTGFMQTTVSTNTLFNEFTRFRNPEEETDVFFSNDARETETKLRYQLTKFYGDWKLVTGFNTQFSDYENNTINIPDNLAFTSEIEFFKYGFFGNITKSFFEDKLDVSFGIRLDEDTFTTASDLISNFSPRLSLSYEFIENWRVSGSLGRYYKIPPYTILGFRNQNNILVNRNSSYTQSDHAVLGIQHYFSASSSISLEGFYKRYEDFPVSVLDEVSLANKGAGFEVLGNEAILTNGRGRSYGTELQFQQKLSKNFYGIFAYTWFFSEFTGLDRNEFLPSVWDSRHLISFTGGYKFKKNWELSARYRFAGETPFAPVDQEATLQNFPEITRNFSQLGNNRLDTFSQLDVRIDKKWNFKKLSLDVFLEAQNVLAQQTPQPPEFGLSRNQNGNIVEPRTLTEITTDAGQVIPSIGVVVDF